MISILKSHSIKFISFQKMKLWKGFIHLLLRLSEKKEGNVLPLKTA